MDLKIKFWPQKMKQIKLWSFVSVLTRKNRENVRYWHFCQIWLIIPYVFDLKLLHSRIITSKKIICSWGKSVGNGFLFRFNWIVGNNLLLSEKSLFIEQNCWNYFIQILAKLKLFYLTLEHWKLSKYSFSGLVFKKRIFKNKLKLVRIKIAIKS